jgi:hypothetical protein
MTFEEIDRLVGGLPPSAGRWSAWWANSRSHVQAVAWLDAGRRVESLHLDDRRVTFASSPR